LTDESTKRVVVFAALMAVVMSSLGGADAMWVKRSDAEPIDKMR